MKEDDALSKDTIIIEIIVETFVFVSILQLNGYYGHKKGKK